MNYQIKKVGSYLNHEYSSPYLFDLVQLVADFMSAHLSSLLQPLSLLPPIVTTLITGKVKADKILTEFELTLISELLIYKFNYESWRIAL